jgi:4-hydroxy-4-methyl-2-oxoglutarate aldolase
MSAATGSHVGFRAFTRLNRPAADLVARFAAYAPPDLSDAMRASYTLEPAILPIWPLKGRIAGPAVTVCAPQGAFNLIKVGMERTQPGDVLVISVGRLSPYAVWGGNVSKGMKHRGAAGVVIDGAARDPEEAEAVGFPVFARAQGTAAPPYDGYGEVNVPIACGGVVIRPGDIIVADRNGAVAVPPEAAEWVLQQVTELKAGHARIQPVLERGEVTNIAAILQGLAQRGLLWTARPARRE